MQKSHPCEKFNAQNLTHVNSFAMGLANYFPCRFRKSLWGKGLRVSKVVAKLFTWVTYKQCETNFWGSRKL